MQTSIQLYKKLEQVVQKFYTHLHLEKFENAKGRKLSLSIVTTVSLGVFKQLCGIATKKAVFKIFEPPCSYKTFVTNTNRFVRQALFIFILIMKSNRLQSHIVKHTDSTDIPVCLNKNGKRHKIMKGFAAWGKTGKGWFLGLKMHITTDLQGKLLAVKFSPGSTSDSRMFMELNKEINGIFVADAAYLSKELADQIYRLGKGFLFAKPRANMKKLITAFQFHLYNTRMLIEINFRNLKAFHGLITSLPKSVNGYFANYIYSLLAYQLA